MLKNLRISRLSVKAAIFTMIASLTGVFYAAELTSVKPLNITFIGDEIKNNLLFDRQLFAENKLHRNQNACSVTSETFDLLKKINRARAKGRRCDGKRAQKASTLLPHCGLNRTAATHATYLEKQGRLTHRSRNGASLGKRASAHHVPWRRVAENLAQGTGNADEVISLWLDSRVHCENMMDTDFLAIGLARSGQTWVAIFAELSPE